MSEIAANLDRIYRRIEAAAQRAGRRADGITLVAVTKTYPLETVIAAYRAGIRHFGENRAQEGYDKVIGLTEWLADDPEQAQAKPPVWHMIGHLQRRQVGQVLGYFALIHSVDSLRLAERINRLAERDDVPTVDVLLECNVSGEESKEGFDLNNWSTDRAKLDSFLETVMQIGALDRISLGGLMTMAPFCDDPDDARPTFQNLAALRRTLQSELPQFDWRQLSMGMTNDFEVAIEEGATIVRIGRAIFGKRAQVADCTLQVAATPGPKGF
ncbi:MAG TPA: YggS family pyridoxal phosphate-dependent enzyme [Anaerolineae bacterium]